MAQRSHLVHAPAFFVVDIERNSWLGATPSQAGIPDEYDGGGGPPFDGGAGGAIRTEQGLHIEMIGIDMRLDVLERPPLGYDKDLLDLGVRAGKGRAWAKYVMVYGISFIVISYDLGDRELGEYFTDLGEAEARARG